MWGSESVYCLAQDLVPRKLNHQQLNPGFSNHGSSKESIPLTTRPRFSYGIGQHVKVYFVLQWGSLTKWEKSVTSFRSAVLWGREPRSTHIDIAFHISSQIIKSSSLPNSEPVRATSVRFPRQAFFVLQITPVFSLLFFTDKCNTFYLLSLNVTLN